MRNEEREKKRKKGKKWYTQQQCDRRRLVTRGGAGERESSSGTIGHLLWEVLYLHYILLMSYLLPDKVCLSIFLYRKDNPWNKLSCLRDFVHSMAWGGTKMNTSTYYYFLRVGGVGRRESGTCRKYSTVQVKNILRNSACNSFFFPLIDMEGNACAARIPRIQP